jgi:hypothetical protein
MESLAILTLKQSDYNLIMGQFSLLDIKPLDVKILPDDSELKDNETYQAAKKTYRKARENKETIAFNLLTQH